ncbi:MAG: hypothetical protein ACRD1T_17765, partial [Acidimicrobiia bacterium]
MKHSVMSKIREEKGAAAVFVTVVLLLMFASAVIAIDAGGLWTDRRDLIIATDAGATAAAGYFALNPKKSCTLEGYNTAKAEALNLLKNNSPKATMTGFTVIPSDCVSGAGRVKVEATTPGSLFFAPVIGINSTEVYSGSVAQWGPIIALKGLLPIGLCQENEHVQEFLNDPNPAMPSPGSGGPLEHPVYANAGTVHRVYFTKLNDSECGASPGNWGWLDFNKNQPPNGVSALSQWIDGGNGYPGTVAINPHDCNDTQVGDQNCPPKSGATGGSLKDALNSIVCTGITAGCPVYYIIMFDDAFCQGGGATCEYDHVAFLPIVLRGFNKITGQEAGSQGCSPEEIDLLTEADQDKCPYFDLEFVERPVTEGQIGPLPPSTPFSPHGAQ